MYPNTPDEEPILAGWWLLCGLLVLIMQLGFMMLESGSVEVRHRPGIAIKNLAMMMTSFAGFTVVGFGLIYGSDFVCGPFNWIGNPLDGLGKVALEKKGGIAWEFCQTGYAVVAATILSGAIAGRSTLQANVIGAALVSCFVYPVIAHAVWGGGLFFDGLSHDFAGAATVHLVGGVVACAAAYVLGPRWDRSYKETEFSGRPVMMVDRGPIDRDMSFATYGVLLLTIGWLGFNGGSIYRESLVYETVPAGFFFVATCLGGAGGGAFAWFWETPEAREPKEPKAEEKISAIEKAFLDKATDRYRPSGLRVDFFGALSGVMAGMVAVTACADLLYFESVDVGVPVRRLPLLMGGLALLVGAAGGLVASVIRERVVLAWGIDDPVDAVSVHVGGGLAGLLVAALLLLNTDPAKAFGQIGMILFVIIFAGLTSFAVFLALDRRKLFRCTVHEETVGLTFGTDPVREYGLLCVRQAMNRLDPRRVREVVTSAIISIQDREMVALAGNLLGPRLSQFLHTNETVSSDQLDGVRQEALQLGIEDVPSVDELKQRNEADRLRQQVLSALRALTPGSALWRIGSLPKEFTSTSLDEKYETAPALIRLRWAEDRLGEWDLVKSGESVPEGWVGYSIGVLGAVDDAYSQLKKSRSVSSTTLQLLAGLRSALGDGRVSPRIQSIAELLESEGMRALVQRVQQRRPQARIAAHTRLIGEMRDESTCWRRREELISALKALQDTIFDAKPEQPVSRKDSDVDGPNLEARCCTVAMIAGFVLMVITPCVPVSLFLLQPIVS